MRAGLTLRLQCCNFFSSGARPPTVVQYSRTSPCRTLSSRFPLCTDRCILYSPSTVPVVRSNCRALISHAFKGVLPCLFAFVDERDIPLRVLEQMIRRDTVLGGIAGNILIMITTRVLWETLCTLHVRYYSAGHVYHNTSLTLLYLRESIIHDRSTMLLLLAAN